VFSSPKNCFEPEVLFVAELFAAEQFVAEPFVGKIDSAADVAERVEFPIVHQKACDSSSIVFALAVVVLAVKRLLSQTWEQQLRRRNDLQLMAKFG